MVEKADKIWFDGEFVDWDEANVHILTHSLHYGLGVFEGIRCYKLHDGSSAVFRLKDHVRRFFDSAHICLMKIPFSQDEIFDACIETLKVNKLEEAYIRPIAFVGEGSMGVYVADNPIRVSIVTWPWGAYLGEDGLKKGIRCRITSFCRVNVNSVMTKSKSTGGYMTPCIAKKLAVESGFEEAIYLDTEGYIAEGSGENIFIVRDGIIKTTPLTAILPGITRNSVMKIAEDKGLKVIEQRFTRDEMYIADEVFFTGTAAEVTPIREIDERQIGEGKPGPVTLELQSTYFDVIRGKVEEYDDWLDHVE